MKEYDKAFEIIDKCNINSTDTKYQLFLPAILNSWIDELVSKQKDTDSAKNITDTKNTKNKITQLYYESKVKGISFAQYIFNKGNH